MDGTLSVRTLVMCEFTGITRHYVLSPDYGGWIIGGKPAIKPITWCAQTIALLIGTPSRHSHSLAHNERT